VGRGKTPAGALPFVPASQSLEALAAASQSCRGCELYKHATQAVFGSGRKSARLVLVGEQPGDQEDRAGAPFVGPAGAILNQALRDAGIDRAQVYLTNAVKHFKWEPRGKRRIHKKPRVSEIVACRPWLEAELKVIRPALIVCLGATAAQTLFGSQFRLMKERGAPLVTPDGTRALATIHPSAVLRAPDAEGRRAAFQLLLGDLRAAKKFIQ
jgi:uracil-DNA glycosylase